MLSWITNYTLQSMVIVYILLLALGISFKVMHLPGAAVILLISAVFPLMDLVLQIRSQKEHKPVRISSALLLVFISLYLLYRFQYWPGNVMNLGGILLALVLTTFFFIRSRYKFGLRLVLIGLLLVFTSFNAGMSNSQFRLFYLPEDPFNPEEIVPVFVIQDLAYDFYREGEFDKASQLIQRNIVHLEENLNEPNVDSWLHNADSLNLLQSRADLRNIQERKWNIFVPLLPEDHHPPK